MASSPESKTILTLAQIAEQLYQGNDFNITRLTSLKSLCADPQAAAQFSLHLARLTQGRLQSKEKPGHLDEETWLQCEKLINEAVPEMGTYLEEPTKEREASLQNLLLRIRKVNDKYENQAWGAVRIIQSKDALLIEKALYGILRPSESSYWGYQLARDYAERYSMGYANSLTPESAPMVEDIANFWSLYHFGKTLEEWRDSQKKRPQSSQKKS
jgi:hypothetical protein